MQAKVEADPAAGVPAQAVLKTACIAVVHESVSLHEPHLTTSASRVGKVRRQGGITSSQVAAVATVHRRHAQQAAYGSWGALRIALTLLGHCWGPVWRAAQVESLPLLGDGRAFM